MAGHEALRVKQRINHLAAPQRLVSHRISHDPPPVHLSLTNFTIYPILTYPVAVQPPDTVDTPFWRLDPHYSSPLTIRCNQLLAAALLPS